MVLDSGEEVLETFSCSIQKAFEEQLLIRLKATGHAVLIDATAAIGQAAFTYILPGARCINITASVYQQVIPLANITEFVCEQCLALNGVPALGDLPAAVSQVEADFPGNAVI